MSDPVEEVRAALRQSKLYLADLVQEHRSAAIPALLAALVEWGVEHGAVEMVRNSLKSASDMSYAAEALFKGERH